MMQEMDKIRNAANAYYLIKVIGNDEEFNYVERFPLDWDLYAGEMPSDEAKGKFHL